MVVAKKLLIPGHIPGPPPRLHFEYSVHLDCALVVAANISMSEAILSAKSE